MTIIILSVHLQNNSFLLIQTLILNQKCYITTTVKPQQLIET